MRFQRSIWTFEAGDAETPHRARAAVRAFAADQGADVHTLAAVELCVSEAVSNAVVHAYRKLGGRGPVEVEARRPEGYLCIYVRDRGSGVRRRSDSPGLGLGLPLIATLAESLELGTGPSEETEVRMTFDLDGAHETLGLRRA
jgi:anti-sigma regulatory factor (Ser/Thr protein kinase)